MKQSRLSTSNMSEGLGTGSTGGPRSPAIQKGRTTLFPAIAQEQSPMVRRFPPASSDLPKPRPKPFETSHSRARKVQVLPATPSRKERMSATTLSSNGDRKATPALTSAEAAEAMPADHGRKGHLSMGHALWVHRFIYNTKAHAAETRRLKEVGIIKVDDNRAVTHSQDEKLVKKPLLERTPSWGILRSQLVKAKLSDAFNNETFHVHGQRYTALRCIGEGGYSKVLEVFNKNKELFALKVVDIRSLSNQTQKEVEKEVHFLKKLQGSKHVIKLIDHERVLNDEKDELLIVLERGECDLSVVLRRLTLKEQLTPTKLRFYWEQMLEAVQSIHNNHIVHADLKPSNFVLVRGNLKVIDFGLAGHLEKNELVFERKFVGGTRDYMSPESQSMFVVEDGALDVSAMRKSDFALKIGYKSDVWALGVILYQLVYKGIAPYSSLPGGKLAKLKALLAPNVPVDFEPVSDPYLMDTMNLCLQKNPENRATLQQLLRHPFLRPCQN